MRIELTQEQQAQVLAGHLAKDILEEFRAALQELKNEADLSPAGQDTLEVLNIALSKDIQP